MRTALALILSAVVLMAQGVPIIGRTAAERRREYGDTSSLMGKLTSDHLRLSERGRTHFARIHPSESQP